MRRNKGVPVFPTIAAATALAVLPLVSSFGAGLVPVGQVSPISGQQPGLTLPIAADVDMHAGIDDDRTRSLPEAFLLQRIRNYVQGQQPIQLGAEERAILRELLASSFCDNVSKKVIQTLSSRLRFLRFDYDAKDGDAVTSVKDFLTNVEQRCALRTVFHDSNWAMLRDGDCAVCIGWEGGADDGKPILSRETFWDGAEGVYLHYDGKDSLAYAVKEWSDEEGRKRTIYFPGEIRRYFIPKGGTQAVAMNGTKTGQAAWQPYSLPNDPLEVGPDGFERFVWPVPWIDAKGAPIGVPFVHLRNPVMPNDGHIGTPDSFTWPAQADKTGSVVAAPINTSAALSGTNGRRDPRYGVSELPHHVLAQNDVVNLCHVEIASARRFTAFQMYWASGVDAKDGDGKPIRLSVRPGKFTLLQNKDAKAGHFPAGDLTQLASSLEIALRTVSRNTEIPMHVFTGEWPSGTAIFQSEMGLNFKVEKIADGLKSAWASVGYWCLKLSNTFAGTGFDLSRMVSAVFDNVARLDPLTLADWAKAVAPYVSNKECLRILGYDEGQIENLEAERDEQNKKQQQQNQSLADIALGRFNTDAKDNPDDGSGKSGTKGNKDPIPPKPAKAPTEP